MHPAKVFKVRLIALRTGERLPKRSHWHVSDEKMLVNLYYTGHGISEIALLLNRSESAVVQKLASLSCLTPPNRQHHPHKKRIKPCCPQCIENECPNYDSAMGCCNLA